MRDPRFAEHLAVYVDVVRTGSFSAASRRRRLFQIHGMPDASEWLSELLEPGKQITTKPNGKVGMLNRYVGKKSIFTAKALEHYKKSVTLPFLRIYGEDPAPTRLLYGNPAVTFLQKTGEPPTAAAYFNSRTNRLDVLHYFDRRTLLDNFAKQFSQTSLAATG